MKKAAITGSSGFIGSAVLRRLIRAGWEVRALLRKSSNRRNLEGLDVEICIGDLNDRDSLDHFVSGCEVLFHIAADYRLWVPRPPDIYRTNVTGTINVLSAAAKAGVGRIVYTSSVATLGLNRDGSPADEETPVTLDDMIGHYKRSKFMAEAEAVRMAQEEGLPVTIVNPSTPVGPRDIRCTPTGKMILEAASGRIPAYVDTGLNLVHVEDVAMGHLLALEKGKIGERYILGGKNLTLKEILSEISSIAGSPLPRIRLPRWPLFPLACACEAWARLTRGTEPLITTCGLRLSGKKMFFSTEKAERELGYRWRDPKIGLRDAVGWYSQNGYLS